MNRWWAVVAAGLSVFMATVDMSIVSVALPTFGETFTVPPSTVQWVVLAYSLPMVALMLPAGRWADAVDKRGAFVLAVLGFAAASAAAGFSPSLKWLLGARLVQGMFGSLMSALVPAIAAAAVPPQQRGRAMGVIGALGPLGSITGPGLGGLLISIFGWRSIFFVNIPAGLLVAIIGASAISAQGVLTMPRGSWAVEAAVLGAGALALFAALHQAALGGAMNPVVLALFGIAILAVVVWRRRPEAMVVSELYSVREFRGAVGALTLLATVGGTLYYLLPFFLQEVLHTPPREIGFTVLTLPLAMGGVAPLGGYLADRWDNRPTALLGALWGAIGLLFLLPLDPDWHPGDVVWRLGVIGLGMGLFAGPNQSAIMGSAPARLAGTAGALSGLARNLGFAFGPALATAVWAAGGSGLRGMRISLGITLVVSVMAAVAAAMVRSAPGGVHAAAHRDTR